MDAQDLAECSDMIMGINSDAAIMQTQHSSVPVTRLLNQECIAKSQLWVLSAMLHTRT